MYKKCYSTRLGHNKYKIHLWDEGGYDEIEWHNLMYLSSIIPYISSLDYEMIIKHGFSIDPGFGRQFASYLSFQEELNSYSIDGMNYVLEDLVDNKNPIDILVCCSNLCLHRFSGH